MPDEKPTLDYGRPHKERRNRVPLSGAILLVVLAILVAALAFVSFKMRL